MSRTFEILERVQQEQELFRIPSVTKNPHGTDKGANHKVEPRVLDALAREEILKLVQCLFLADSSNGRHGPRRVVFCGIEEADGSNLLCAHVGRSLAEQVRSQVCIVDANLRFPGVGRLFEPVPLESEQPSATMVSRKVGDNLWLFCGDSVSANSAGPTLDQLRPCIRDLDDAFAYAVINAPPIGLYNDAVLLGQMADGVVLVVEANSTRRAATQKAKQALEANSVRVLGIVLNNRTFPIPARIYRLL